MKKSYILSLGLLLCSLSGTLFSQGGEGTIKLEITEATSDNEQMAAGLEMMVGTITEVSYKNDQSMTKLNMMGGMVQVDVKLDKDGNMDMLMNAMGNKMWITATKAVRKISEAESENPYSDLDITYDEDDTKTIAGFECYKMIATSPASEDFVLEAYITPDIKINAAVMQGIDITEFNGFPLEYIFDAGTMRMTITTIEYLTTVDDAVFDLNTDGYTKMSWDEFKSSMGQMGGIGF